MRFKEGPPPVFDVQPESGRKVLVPAWMTKPEAAALALEERRRVDVQHLLDVAAAVEGALSVLFGDEGERAAADADHLRGLGVIPAQAATGGRKSRDDRDRGGRAYV